MNTRIATLLAAATDADGNVDREQFYRGLMLSPDDPVAIAIEALIATEHSSRVLKTSFVEQKKEAEATFERSVQAISHLLEIHGKELAAAQGTLNASARHLEAGQEAAQSAFGTLMNALATHRGELVTYATKTATAARVVSIAAVVTAFVAGALIGTIGTLVYLALHTPK